MKLILDITAFDFKMLWFFGVLFSAFFSGFIVYFIFAYQKKQKQNATEKKELLYRFQSEINQAQLEIGETTLKKISQEIHDNIGQSLTMAGLQLNQIQSVNSEALDAAKNLIQRSLQDLRDLSRSLNNTYQLELGLENAVKRELELIRKVGLETQFTSEEINIPVRVPNTITMDQVEIILLRCTQEAISNSLKYAQASLIQVHMIFSEDHCLSMMVRDNGSGISKENFTQGIGMRSMKERMEMIGGKFIFQSSKDEGTTCIFELSKV